jgi:hypothetical protein
MPSDVMQKPYLLAELALALRDIGEMHTDMLGASNTSVQSLLWH